MNPPTTADPIEVRVLSERAQALRGIVSDMAVLLEIKTGGVSKVKRPAIELAIVLVRQYAFSTQRKYFLILLF
jgi:hypothetical protein